MFEQLVNEASSRFNLSTTSVTALLHGILSLMINDRTGGVEGFVDRFRQAGIGHIITSWYGGGREARAITGTQLESALGAVPLDRLSASTGLSRGVVTSVLTYLLPKVMVRLTPGGYLPSNSAILIQVSSFLDGRATRDRGVLPERPIVSERSAATEGPVGPDRSGFPPWLPWATAAALALIALMWLRPTPASVQPQLTVSNRDGRITYSGLVRDEATRTSVVNALHATFGEASGDGDIRVDRRVKRAVWLPRLDELFSALKTPGAEFVLNGNDVRVGGWLSAADRAALSNRLGGIFGGAPIGSLGDAATDAVRIANDRAVSALRAVGTSGASSADELVRAMNLSIINFASGSAEIPADSMDVIRSSAAALGQAPAGSLIEIAGHTDSSGDASQNLALSQARADAVRNALVAAGVPSATLRARGYGDTRPRASNDTEYGRFQNRRIEYSLAPAAERASHVR